MKAWVHRDTKGHVLAVVATDESERGTLSLTFDDAAEVHELEHAGTDDPRDLEQLQRVLSMENLGGAST
jgi:hypothetical protein